MVNLIDGKFKTVGEKLQEIMVLYNERWMVYEYVLRVAINKKYATKEIIKLMNKNQ